MHGIKESSDALDPSAVSHAVAVPAERRTHGDYVALAVATCGVGFMPVAPGTWGSAVGVGLYLLISWLSAAAFAAALARGWELPPLEAFRTTFVLAFIILITLAGTWAATRCEPLFKKKDPGAVVVDEVAGQLITFLFVPWGAGWWAVVAGFVAFRVFDIWKPYPIRRLESLEAGLGVMADDVLAGAYAATLMSLLTFLHLLL